jgi:lipopolysaccharide transport system permease protein
MAFINCTFSSDLLRKSVTLNAVIPQKPRGAAPEKYRDIIAMNPLTPIFETFKYSCMGCGSLDWGGLLYSTVFMLITLFFAVVIFSRTERNFMDTV